MKLIHKINTKMKSKKWTLDNLANRRWRKKLQRREVLRARK